MTRPWASFIRYRPGAVGNNLTFSAGAAFVWVSGSAMRASLIRQRSNISWDFAQLGWRLEARSKIQREQSLETETPDAAASCWIAFRSLRGIEMVICFNSGSRRKV